MIAMAAIGRELRQLNLARCRELRAALERVKRLESAVANSLGLAMLFADSEIVMEPEYLRLLESLAAAASGRGPLAGGALRELPLRVRSGPDDGNAGSPAESDSRPIADEGLGIVIVRADAIAKEVLAYLEVRDAAAS